MGTRMESAQTPPRAQSLRDYRTLTLPAVFPDQDGRTDSNQRHPRLGTTLVDDLDHLNEWDDLEDMRETPYARTYAGRAVGATRAGGYAVRRDGVCRATAGTLDVTRGRAAYV